MRIRSLKPEFWRSKDITSMPLFERLLFVGLWSYVDDNGVGVDDLASVIGDLFADDMLANPRETVASVSGGLQKLAEAGLIRRYSVGSRAYLFVSNWEKHQRIDKPGKPRFPRPDGDVEVSESPFATLSRDSRDTLAPGTGEQGNRGTGEQTSSSEVADATPRPDVDHLLDLLDAEIIRNGGKAPARSKKNLDAMRLLLDRDGRTVEQVETAIRWCQSDEFWRANILSAVKLRDKYDQLRLAAKRTKTGQSAALPAKYRPADEWRYR